MVQRWLKPWLCSWYFGWERCYANGDQLSVENTRDVDGLHSNFRNGNQIHIAITGGSSRLFTHRSAHRKANDYPQHTCIRQPA
jgi:hypothetical protein